MKVRLISPFDDAEQIWIGLDEPGMRRKVFRFVSPDTGSEEFMAGITIFEPGEASSYHVHAESEEINLVLGGSGLFVSEGEEAEFGPGHAMWVPKGSTTSTRTRAPSRSSSCGCTPRKPNCRVPNGRADGA